MVIQVENVSKIIKGNMVIDCVSAEFSSGKVYGLQGINGSGKTMLMRLISGLIYPTEGRIVIDGKILGKEIAFSESIGILIENPAFLDNYSGFANLKLLASIQNKIDDEQIYKTLERVGLEPDSRKKYKKYSLGMKQKLGIAGAVMEKPELLILDEPANALDKEGIERLKKIVQEEKERGVLIILSCHDSALLEAMADVIYSMENGRLLKQEEAE
ncbi:MAG: ABC transporter ATP-binding protein [Lacrimispora saccharolytica]